MAMNAYRLMGENIVESTFQPPKDPYAFVPAGEAREEGEYFFKAYKDDVSVLNTTYAPVDQSETFGSIYPLSLLVLCSFHRDNIISTD